MNAHSNTSLYQGLRWQARRYVRKSQRVMSDPRMLADAFVVPRLSAPWLVNTVRLRSLPPFRIAARLSYGWDWARLSDFVRSLDHPVLSRIGTYLDHSTPDLAGAKAEAAEAIRQDIVNHRLLQSLPQREMWDASRVATQFGFFDAALAFRLAALGRLLQYRKTPVNLRQQVILELAGMTASELECLAHDYGLDLPQAVLSGQSDGQHYSVREILNVYRQASESWHEQMCYNMPLEAFRRMRELGQDKPDLTGDKILFIGPSMRDSEPVSPEWPDKIMRVGYMGSCSTTDGDEWPTDITLYRDHKLCGLTTDAMRELFSERIVFLTKLRASTVSRLPFGNGAFYSQFSGDVLVQRQPNAGPEGVMCVLDSGARQVHVSHMDLLLNSAYPSGYVRKNVEKRLSKSGNSLEVEVKCRSMALDHPPVSQFSILKLFANLGVLTTDYFLASLLSAPVRAYHARLQESYYPFVTGDD